MIIELKEGKSYYSLLLLFFVLSFAFIPTVSAIPPITAAFSGADGFAVEANIQDYYKVNEGACIHIYVFNSSDGIIMSYPTVSCKAELTDSNGKIGRAHV